MSKRHSWFWHKPRDNWRQCQKCGMELPISHHIKVGACEPTLDEKEEVVQKSKIECYVQCNRCSKKVSNTVLSDLPEGLVIRAFVECPECIEKHTKPKPDESLLSPQEIFVVTYGHEPTATQIEEGLHNYLSPVSEKIAKAQAEISFKEGYRQGTDDTIKSRMVTSEPWDREQTVFEDGRKAGIKEAAEWIKLHSQVEHCDPDVQAYFNEYRWVDETEWQDFLKSKGIK